MNEGVPAKAAMKKPPVILYTDESMQEAAAKMYHMKNYDAPVIDDAGHVVGSLSGDTLMTAMMKGLSPQTKVEEMMERQVSAVLEGDLPLPSFKWNPATIPVVNESRNLTGILYPEEWFAAVEKDAKQRRDILEALLNGEEEGVVVIGDGHKVIFSNRQAEKLLSIHSGDRITDVLDKNKITDVLSDQLSEETYSFYVKDKKMRVKKQTITAGKKTFIALWFKEMAPSFTNGEEEGWKEKAEQMETILELAYDGIIMVDRHGVITMISKEYASFLEMDEQDIIGRHVTDVIEHTRMHIVAETGKPEIADIQPIKGDYMVATRLPIFKDGKLEGAVGKVLFKNLGGFKALKKRMEKLEKELANYRGDWNETNRAKYQFDQLIGTSSEWTKAKELALKASETESSVLLLGESGTGKELFAHAIHNASPRSPGPFVKVNCAAIPNDLIESELFGYIEGSFTGAKRGGKKGKFEAADGGTIFLDEIGELPIHMQVKLLRVLQEREVEKVGATSAKPVDIRVIAATNRNLEKMIGEGDFRLDLFYRLNVFSIHIPPLRERPEDIEQLVPYFLKKLSLKLGKEVKYIDRTAMDTLVKYNWPGNTRELENVIERTANVVDSYQTITSVHLPDKLTGVKVKEKPEPLSEQMREAEKQAILHALRYTEGNKSQAAKLLGVSRTALYEKIARMK
ncbi:sigma-54-dependent Fis family transcriptional regulator [Alteribacter keqinensis]|uniref:PAS domain-containing protein n=1 Tax=Alteribacter keqinensis TaxID=2483800 RepID=A0A3M7TMA3_9BACI|nr:sigma-54-dependent Fis family transcriptional regulator [Alteribacter keqinensis]RNA66048.1 PAS domain-containing protein [Alteribacter keqinensis]